MKKLLILLLFLNSGISVASESGKICVSPVLDAENYQVTLNESKKYNLSDLVQICINEASLENTNIIKIYNKKTNAQELKVSFKGYNSTVACIKPNKITKKWSSSMAGIGAEHCGFN